MRHILFAAVLILAGCQSAYYAAAEKVGYHKRQILVDRIEDTQTSQQEAQQQFSSAVEQLKTLVHFNGGNLEQVYQQVKEEYDDAKSAAASVNKHIDAVNDVAEALFAEWQLELEQYQSVNLRQNSAQQLRETRQRYTAMLTAMRRAEAKMTPILRQLNDNQLYLKHNLNAAAISAIGAEFQELQLEINRLVQEMNAAIAESDRFIASLK